jgi:hypothetical protein
MFKSKDQDIFTISFNSYDVKTIFYRATTDENLKLCSICSLPNLVQSSEDYVEITKYSYRTEAAYNLTHLNEYKKEYDISYGQLLSQHSKLQKTYDILQQEYDSLVMNNLKRLQTEQQIEEVLERSKKQLTSVMAEKIKLFKENTKKDHTIDCLKKQSGELKKQIKTLKKEKEELKTVNKKVNEEKKKLSDQKKNLSIEKKKI